MIDIASLPSLPICDRKLLPEISAIYLAVGSDGVVRYVGRSVNLRQRWLNHHRYAQLRQYDGVKIAYLVCDSELLDEVESALIEWFKPPLNGSECLGAKKRMSLYLDPDLKERLEKLAKARKRSLSNLIEVCMEEIADQAEKDGEI